MGHKQLGSPFDTDCRFLGDCENEELKCDECLNNMNLKPLSDMHNYFVPIKRKKRLLTKLLGVSGKNHDDKKEIPPTLENEIERLERIRIKIINLRILAHTGYALEKDRSIDEIIEELSSVINEKRKE